MNRIALTTLALALTAAGTASAQDAYGYRDGYRGDTRYENTDPRYTNAPRSDYAQVIRVEAMGNRYDSRYGDQYGSNLRQECWNEQTNGYDNGYYRDSNGRLYRGDGRSNTNGGTLVGALIGGALGNQVGKGDGRTAATIGGAVIGGVIGSRVASNNDGYDQYRDDAGVVRRCRTVSDGGSYQGYQGVTGYNVTYRYAGQTYHAVTRYNPGRTIRVVVDVRPQDSNVAYGR